MYSTEQSTVVACFRRGSSCLYSGLYTSQFLWGVFSRVPKVVCLKLWNFCAKIHI